jgi:hypothetical protein
LPNTIYRLRSQLIFGRRHNNGNKRIFNAVHDFYGSHGRYAFHDTHGFNVFYETHDRYACHVFDACHETDVFYAFYDKHGGNVISESYEIKKKDFGSSLKKPA